MRQLTASPQAGFATLTSASSESKEKLLSFFGATLWGDGTYANLLTSWNLNDIFSHLNPPARLQTYASGSAAPSLSASVRGGSDAYLAWTPPTNHAPTSLRIRTPGGSALPSHMTLWIWRYQ